ncbi:hypothetical protein [Streptomyces kronopolitis]|uniref:hypothetical protein n=1 Tax=Streptomyces kronopolitis TaxID=1612435 RepID=UPI0034240EBF
MLRRTGPMGPPAYRSEPLCAREDATRATPAALDAVVATEAATTVRQAALRAPSWAIPPSP